MLGKREKSLPSPSPSPAACDSWRRCGTLRSARDQHAGADEPTQDGAPAPGGHQRHPGGQYRRCSLPGWGVCKKVCQRDALNISDRPGKARMGERHLVTDHAIRPRSISTTRYPCSARREAVIEPAGPPPTTQTSATRGPSERVMWARCRIMPLRPCGDPSLRGAVSPSWTRIILCPAA